MSGIARHLLAILLLPFVVVVLVPRWLLRVDTPLEVRWADTTLETVGRLLGAPIFMAGLCLFAWCVLLFARDGRGTLAPWDPTRALVARGPYAHVRNPMITGVAAMLLGEALFFGSALLAGWLMVFVLLNHLFFLVREEPGLVRRFGPAYVEYRQRVPRWLPRPPH
jgi:protein-S-isoprenylcysteine O-methyltransferase Ste14